MIVWILMFQENLLCFEHKPTLFYFLKQFKPLEYG